MSIKLLVFDINKTLLRKSKDKSSYKFHSIYIHFRPHLSMLWDFIKEHDLKCMLWTNSNPNNANILGDYLKNMGMDPIDVFSANECNFSNGKKKGEKPLYKIDSLGYNTREAVLIDDSIDKRADGDNFIQIKSFIEEDDEIINLINTLDLYIKCTKIDCSIRKNLNSTRNIINTTFPKMTDIYFSEEKIIDISKEI